MTETYVLFAGDGYGAHVEAGLRYVTACGRVLDAETTERERYEKPRDPDHRHASVCFDCHSEGHARLSQSG